MQSSMCSFLASQGSVTMTTDLSGQEYNSRHGMFPTIIDAGNSYIGLFKFVAKVESFCHWIYKNLQFPSLGEIFFLITYKSLVVYNINDI